MYIRRFIIAICLIYFQCTFQKIILKMFTGILNGNIDWKRSFVGLENLLRSNQKMYISKWL